VGKLFCHSNFAHIFYGIAQAFLLHNIEKGGFIGDSFGCNYFVAFIYSDHSFFSSLYISFNQ